MKALLTLMLVAGTVHAAPFLYADPYPPPADATKPPQPDTATFTVNGGSQKDCQIVATSNNGKQPKCDLASITQAGTYTLVMSVHVAGNCVPGADTSTCTAASTASSTPFQYVLRTSNVSTPSHLLVAP